MFSARKAAQVAAVFVHKQGGTISVLKLVKLIYLADRESFARYGAPITFDRYVAMPHGPVPSLTYDLLGGNVDGPPGAQWDEWISDRANHDVALRREFSRDQLDQLSDVDLEVIDVVWDKFGKMDKWSLRDYTHDHCSEWKDPQGSSLRIRDRDILLAVGVSEPRATALAAEVEVQRKLDTLFKAL